MNLTSIGFKTTIRCEPDDSFLHDSQVQLKSIILPFNELYISEIS